MAINKVETVSENSDALTAQLQRQVENRNLLLDITQRIASSGTLADILAAVCSAAQGGLDADGVCIVLGRDQADASYGTSSDLSTTLGQSADALLARAGSSAVEVVDLASEPKFATTLQSTFKTLILAPLMAHTARHGIIVIGYTQARPFSDDDRAFLAGVVGQTAVAVENAQAFEAVQQSQGQLAAILASTADPVLVIDAHETIVLLNPAAERALGVSASSAIGHRVGDVIDAEPLLQLLRAPSTSESIEWQNATGQTYAPRVSEINADAHRRGRVLILQDITHYKNLHANQTEFVSTVSHDLRSPLTYMQGYATMLPMFGDLNPKQKDAAEKIIGGIVQMTDLVDKILDAGRLDPETGYYELMREPCDVAKMTADIVNTHVSPAEKKNLKLDADIDPALPLLNLDEVMLRRALNNLVDNAIKYSPDGGTITVGATIKDQQLLFSVRDTGTGISEDAQGTLFGKFVRVRTKINIRVKGSGLGLFIVKNVAQKHGGDAWVKSVVGEGSTFFIGIPLEGPNRLPTEAKADAKKAE